MPCRLERGAQPLGMLPGPGDFATDMGVHDHGSLLVTGFPPGTSRPRLKGCLLVMAITTRHRSHKTHTIPRCPYRAYADGDGREAVGENVPETFGQLLRQLRVDADLTQEELAEAARLSPRSVSDLERGIHPTARKETARLLAHALGLTGPAQIAFEAAARGRAPAAVPAGGVAAATRTLPRDVISFTGRDAELRQLMAAPADGADSVLGIHALGGMAGIGKTALAVHAAHRLAPQFPDGQIFLPLHGHTPGQRPVDPADALASLLLMIGVPAERIPPGLTARMALWRDRVAGQQLLLILDDAAGSEQVRPLLPGTGASLVLVTSRRHLTTLEDARAVSLDTLPPRDAAELLVRLAGRPGLDPSESAVAEIIRLCGYLPLAIGMLARQLHHHPAWTPDDVGADLADARDRLELIAAEDMSVAAAFDLSYQDLSQDQQRLFRRIGLHPGTDVDARAAAALDDTDVGLTRRNLAALYDQYLLTEPTRGRYRMHDLIREHARALAATDPAPDSDAAVGRLLGYYLQATRAAAGRLPEEDALAWLEAERPNVHAAADYAAAHGWPGHACGLSEAMGEFFRRQGHWDQARALHGTALEAARRAGDKRAEASALSHLGRIQHWSGERPAAIAAYARALELYRGLGDRPAEASTVYQLGVLQYYLDDYPAADAGLVRALELYQDLGDGLGVAATLRELGIVRALTGDLDAAAARLEQSLDLYRDLDDPIGEAKTLMDLGEVQSDTRAYPAATANLTRALGLCRDLGDRPVEANVLKVLGKVQYQAGLYPAAAENLTRALELCRELGHRPSESDALTYLGLVQQAAGDREQAVGNLRRALELYRDLGDRLGEAQALNHLGELLLVSAETASARAHHQQALEIATSIGAPIDQAHALEGIGRTYLRDGHPDQAAPPLRQALAIYQRFGSPHAPRVEALVRDHNLKAPPRSAV
jgi:tetratricopeptide (TPR) repeat protein/transcriptional regulator with XRE-family HTH domain